jgi:hypothetical protein
MHRNRKPPPWPVLIIGSGVSSLLFVMCCYAALEWYSEISEHPTLTYGLLGMMAVVMFAAPVFFVKLADAAISSAFHRWRNSRCYGS